MEIVKVSAFQTKGELAWPAWETIRITWLLSDRIDAISVPRRRRRQIGLCLLVERSRTAGARHILGQQCGTVFVLRLMKMKMLVVIIVVVIELVRLSLSMGRIRLLLLLLLLTSGQRLLAGEIVVRRVGHYGQVGRCRLLMLAHGIRGAWARLSLHAMCRCCLLILIGKGAFRLLLLMVVVYEVIALIIRLVQIGNFLPVLMLVLILVVHLMWMLLLMLLIMVRPLDMASRLILGTVRCMRRRLSIAIGRCMSVVCIVQLHVDIIYAHTIIRLVMMMAKLAS